MIQAKGLKRAFGNFVAVRNVSFDIEPARGVVGLLGPNGAGKTTTMRLLTGYLRPDEGCVTISGIDSSTEEGRLRIKQSIGYLPENTPLYPEMLVSEYLEFMGRIRGLDGPTLQKAGRRMLEELELGSHFYTPIGLLSRGFRQRVGLAGALIHDPSVIILDEPTGGLDPNQIEQIRGLIRRLAAEKTVLLSTHILQEVEDICERVIIIHGGEVVADQPTGELKRSETIHASLALEGSDALVLQRELQSVVGVDSALLVESSGETEFFPVEIQWQGAPEDLLAALVSRRFRIRSFSPGSRSLQEIFQELTHKV
ncbi:MAG: ABC transporter ATP-binding protein [Leptospiraceae bacterium]|nr:ABC transporter ATP-binding protein [Leptospiraceae bacterium]